MAGLQTFSSKSSIGTPEFGPLFGGTGGPAVSTPSLSFGEGALTRDNTEFLDESRRTLADLRANRAGFGGGFRDFRRARLQDVENARARTVGNLRSQLGRRGILGASFAGDAITRTELDFQQQADKVSAEIDVQEFEFNLQNLEQESQIALANLTREFQELGLSLQFISGINSAIVRRDEIAAQIEIARFERRSGNSIRNFSSFGPGGPLGSFGRSGSSTGGFRGSTGTTATSVPFTTQFASNFDIASTINPNTGGAGSFSSAFLG